MHIEKAAKVLKILGQESRIRILRILLEAQKELCVCEIVDAMALPQYAVSRHLKALKQMGLVTERRAGTWILYSLVSPKNSFIKNLFSLIKSIPPREDDRVRLKRRLKLRLQGKCIIGYKY
jgi:ArsR family transcriptional regulator